MSTDTEKKLVTTVLGIIVGFALGALRCGCGYNLHTVPIPNPKTIDSAFAEKLIPPTHDTVPVTAYKYLPGKRDTVVRVDTLFKGLPPFRLVSEEFVTSKSDTITTEYSYPANRFIFQVRYSPDTTFTVTVREYIQPSRIQFGLQLGAGAAIGVDGVVRPGVFIGFGANIKL